MTVGAFQSILPALAARFARRCEAQSLKGKRRDRAAIEFLVGAGSAAVELNREAHAQQILWVCSMVTVRGADEFLKHAPKETDDGAGC